MLIHFVGLPEVGAFVNVPVPLPPKLVRDTVELKKLVALGLSVPTKKVVEIEAKLIVALREPPIVIRTFEASPYMPVLLVPKFILGIVAVPCGNVCATVKLSFATLVVFKVPDEAGSVKVRLELALGLEKVRVNPLAFTQPKPPAFGA